MWPKAKLTDKIRMAMESDPLAKFQLVEGVVFLPEEGQYRIIVMDVDSRGFLLDVYSKSSPWVVARWSKASNEVGGRGPVVEALPTIRSLNALTEEIMRNVALSTSPPWTAASDGVFNPYMFQIEPNKMIPVSRQSMGELPLKKLDVAGDVNMGNLEMNDLRQQVKDALYDNPVRPVTAPEQTATEVMIRQQQFMEEIGPAFGRQSVELFPKVINRIIFILQKKGYLPPKLLVDNKNISIRYKSPLVRSADLQKIQNVQNYSSIMQQMVGPQLALATMNLELLPEWLSDKLDVDETLVKSPAQMVEIIQQVMQSMNPPSPTDEQQPPNQSLANQVNDQKALGAPAA
jgi:hypothetical protein